MCLKRMQSGEMKGKVCANGHLKRDYITKEESSLPIVSLYYALIGSCVLDALDDRKVIKVNLPGAFLQGD